MEKTTQKIRTPFLVVLAAALVAAGISAMFPKGTSGVEPTTARHRIVMPSRSEVEAGRTETVVTSDKECGPLRVLLTGHPYRYRTEWWRYEVPAGRRWTLSNVSLLAERFTDGHLAEAGEWTVMMAAEGITVSQSSLDAGSGIALQGQGPVDVTLNAGETLSLGIWLRPGTDPAHYYFTLSAMGRDCPTRTP